MYNDTDKFEWDNAKAVHNFAKHGVSFEEAEWAFADPHRFIIRDETHSITEKRFFCFGKVDGRVMTVRFTYRGDTIRLIGAAYWRKGDKIYETQGRKKD
jgi:uncharacterized DUF497 family protein